METGVVTVLRICCGHDPGRVINRLGAEGQVEGGAVQGMSFAMMENLAPVEGRLRGTNFHDYLMATSMDAPPIEHDFFESMDPHGPFGAKGLAEVAINPISGGGLQRRLPRDGRGARPQPAHQPGARARGD